MSTTLRQPEALPIVRKKPTPIVDHSQEIDETLAAWQREHSPGTLSDVLALSVLPEASKVVRDAARDALGRNLPLTPAVASLAQLMASDPSSPQPDHGPSETIDEHVRSLRQLLRLAPSNPIALLDMAQAKVVHGDTVSAERFLKTALQSYPNQRLVLRTLSRFYVHVGKMDQAHALIARHPNTLTDPWLLASEIALSQVNATTSRFVAKSQRLLKEQQWGSAHTSELAGALAGLELSHGKVRYARDLYRLALKQPNDNVLAQALFDQTWLGLSISHAQLSAQKTAPYEALLFQAWRDLQAAEAEQHAVRWAAEEPFSSRPLQFLSFLHIARGQYDDALLQTERGLSADDRDGGLMANRAFALAATGRESDAVALLRKQHKIHGEIFAPNRAATLGFLELRKERWDRADHLYGEALALFERRGDATGTALCLAFYARAARDLGHPHSIDITARALEAQKLGATLDSAIYLSINGMLEPITASPTGATALRHATTWVYDPVNHSLTSTNTVGRPGAPLIVTKEA